MNYQESLDFIFQSYMEKKDLIKDLPYRKYKNTKIIHDLIKEFDLLPLAEKVIKISGSKGKGTTARTLDYLLRKESSKKIGLFVSPEEICHHDRISINGESLSKKKFASIMTALAPRLNNLTNSFNEYDYYSPYGLFMLIALAYFKEMNVDFIILECGRGVRFDDSNAVPSQYSILTSILPEHLSYFGKSELDVFADKIAIAETSQKVFVDSTISKFDLPKNVETVPEDNNLRGEIPSPYYRSINMAHHVAQSILKRKFDNSTTNLRTAAFGSLKINDRHIIYDCVIEQSCLDRDWLMSHRKAVFIISIPDDKDIHSFLEPFKKLNLTYQLVALKGKRGYLNYEKYQGLEYKTYHYQHDAILTYYINAYPNSPLVFLGTQTFIRSIKSDVKPCISLN